MLLACKSHIGTRNLDQGMHTYVWKRRNDGVYLMDLAKTWEKLQLAARVIASIKNPKDVTVISARPWGQRAVLKFAAHTGCTAISGRFTPGTFTNKVIPKFQEPKLLVCTDPKTDHQPITEASYVNLPVIAFCHSDSPLNNVDIAIPCNNKAKHSIGLMWWLLAREVRRLRNPKENPRNQPWDVMVDLYFYRDPEEERRDELLADAAALDEEADADDPYLDEPVADWEEGDWAQGEQWAGAAEPVDAATADGWDQADVDVPVGAWDAGDDDGSAEDFAAE